MARASEGNEQLLCSFCGKSPAAGQEADRRARRLHLRRVHRSLQRDHRRGADDSGARSTSRTCRARRTSTPSSTTTSSSQEEAKRTLAVAVYNHYKRVQMGAERRRRRAPEVEHPAARPDRVREDAAGADARADPERPVRDRRRDCADRGRLRRRGRREHPPQADPGRGLRHQEGRDRDHLHRRGRQDRAQGGQPVDHARRVRRGRPAGAAEDPRRDRRLGAAAGRPQAPAPGVPLDRHDERPLHLRRRVRRAREDHRQADRQERGRLRRRHPLAARHGQRRSCSRTSCRRTCSRTG